MNDRILIRRIGAEKVSKGGIIIPDAAQEKAIEGTVVAVGPGRVLENGRRLEPEVKPGDRVLFAKYANETKVGDEQFVLLHEVEILGVVTE